MRILDRYIFRQLIVPVGGAVAALTAIALLSQSLSEFDLIIERGQSAWTFIKITLLSLPQLSGLIFPIAIFVGTVIALTRLQGEHEFTACYASGLSLAKVAYPIVRIGVYVALLNLIINLFIQPLTMQAMRREMFEVKNDLISTLVREGEFATAASGLTIYVQRIDQNGLLRQIYIRTPATNGQDQTYVAKEGRIKKIDDSSVLVMRRGSRQQIGPSGTLDETTFDEWSLDITPYFANDDFLLYKEGDRYMRELFFPNMSLPGIGGEWERRNWDKLIAEGNARLSAPLYNIAFVLMAIVSVLGGRFSRNGYAGRIAIAGALAGATRILGVVALTASNESAIFSIFQYIVPMVPILICISMIRKQDSRRLFRRSVHAASPKAALRPL